MNSHDTIMDLTFYRANKSAGPPTLLVLAHGAGAGQSHPFMVRYARGLADRGISVATFNFPYMEARKSRPDAAPVLEEAFRHAILAAQKDKAGRSARLLIGGKSMGGRMATHLAADPAKWPAVAPLGGVIALGYPLNAGGARKQDRVSHLLQIRVPTLIVQGTRDSFGGPADIRGALQDRQPRITIHEVPTGDHSFAVQKSSGRTQIESDAQVMDAIAAWLSALK
jgi:predicted alpha/beta-hydrolase family hydrolase